MTRRTYSNRTRKARYPAWHINRRHSELPPDLRRRWHHKARSQWRDARARIIERWDCYAPTPLKHVGDRWEHY